MFNDYFLLKEITVKKRTKMKEFKESIIDQKLPLGDVKNLSMKEIENILRNEDVL